MKNDPRSCDHNFYNCVKKPEKNSGLQRGLNPWPRDTGATLYQLSYEATDVGSRSIVGSYVHRERYVSEWCIWNKSYVNCGYEIKWRMILAVVDHNFYNCVNEAWKKFRTSTGLEPVTSRYRCDALPTELWSHWRWEQVNCGFICSRERYVSEWCIWNKSYVNCGYEIKWRMILAVADHNFYNCVKRPEKNSGLQRGLNPWPRDTGTTLYQLSYEATDVGSRSIVKVHLFPWKICKWMMHMK